MSARRPRRSRSCGSAPRGRSTRSARAAASTRDERFVETRQVRIVAGAVGELDVEAARHTREGIVPRAVHAEGEYPFVAGEDRVGAVPLVHVEVDDRGARDPAFVLQGAHRHRDVVEHAEALAVIGEGVVRAAGEVDREAVGERGACGGDGAPTARCERSTSSGDQGKPMRRISAASSVPASSASTYAAACARRSSSRVARGGSRMRWRGSKPRAMTRWRSSAYFSMGKRCPAGSGWCTRRNSTR